LARELKFKELAKANQLCKSRQMAASKIGDANFSNKSRKREKEGKMPNTKLAVKQPVAVKLCCSET